MRKIVKKEMRINKSPIIEKNDSLFIVLLLHIGFVIGFLARPVEP